MTQENLIAVTKKARAALSDMISGEVRHRVLLGIADALLLHADEILAENQRDMAAAERGGIKKTMLDRLLLTRERLSAMASSVREVASLPDPLGCADSHFHKNGMEIMRYRVPLGVIAMIYEARPNVTVDAAVLALKSGNAVFLRGGKESFHSNRALVSLMQRVLSENGASPDLIAMPTDTDRETVRNLLSLRGHIDLVIPRGGKSLICEVVENAKVPVIETGAGNCHIYVEQSADFEKAIRVLVNAKVSRPSVCNAAESLLCDRAIADAFLPLAKTALEEKGVVLRGCAVTKAILPDIALATEEDFYTEYNDLILSVKVVSDVYEAIDHINETGTRHSEAIITESDAAAAAFMAGVDAAVLYRNASTRFTDGGEFGLGAEIGISTQKLHVRGPFAMEALTTMQYRVVGDGDIRA